MLAERLVQARKRLGFKSREDFANALNMPFTTLRTYEQGTVDNIPHTFLYKLNEQYNIHIDWLLTGKGNMLLEDENSNPLPTVCQHPSEDKNSISLNYYPNIVTAVGYSELHTSNIQPQTMTLDRRFCKEFLTVGELNSLDVIKVTGDSMEPYVHNGELVLIQRHEKAMDGETVIAKVNGHIYIKRYHTDPFGKWVKLISDNDPSSTIEIVGDDLQYFSIVGIIRAKVKVF